MSSASVWMFCIWSVFRSDTQALVVLLHGLHPQWGGRDLVLSITWYVLQLLQNATIKFTYAFNVYITFFSNYRDGQQPVESYTEHIRHNSSECCLHSSAGLLALGTMAHCTECFLKFYPSYCSYLSRQKDLINCQFIHCIPWTMMAITACILGWMCQKDLSLETDAVGRDLHEAGTVETGRLLSLLHASQHDNMITCLHSTSSAMPKFYSKNNWQVFKFAGRSSRAAADVRLSSWEVQVAPYSPNCVELLC